MIDNTDLDSLVSSWLTLSEVADRLDVSMSKVKQFLREDELVAVAHGDRGQPHVPEALLDSARIVTGLSGTLTLLYDAGYTRAEAIRWLFSNSDMLSATPVEALRQQRKKEVHRSAQLTGF